MSSMNQETCKIIAKTLDARPLLAFIENLIDKQDVESLNTVLNETMARPIYELNLNPSSFEGKTEKHTFFKTNHSVWAAALVGLVRFNAKLKCNYSSPIEDGNEVSSNCKINITPEMKEFAKICANKLIDRFDNEISEEQRLGTSQMQILYGDLKLEMMNTMGAAAQCVAAMFNDVDLYKKYKRGAVDASSSERIYFEIGPKMPGAFEEKHGLFSFREDEDLAKSLDDPYFNRAALNPVHLSLLFGSADVLEAASHDFHVPYRVAIYNQSGGTNSFSIYHWLCLQEKPLSKDVLSLALDALPNSEKINIDSTELRSHLASEMVCGKYKNASRDILDVCPQILDEYSLRLLNHSLYTSNTSVLSHAIKHAKFEPVEPGEWFQQNHSIYKAIQGYSDAQLVKKNLFSEVRYPHGKKIQPDATHLDEALFIVFKEMKERGILDQAFTARTYATGETLGHFCAYASLLKSASFLCKEGLDMDVQDKQGNTMISYANAKTRDDLAAVIRSTKALAEAEKVTKEILNGLSLDTI